MKKAICSLIILLFSILTQAQNWCAPGAEWHFRAHTTWPSIKYQDGYIRVASEGTVIALGQTCDSLTATFYGVRFSMLSPSVVINNYFSLVTYESNHVVYAYNTSTNSFDTLFNFNAAIGDEWLNYREGTNCFMPRSKFIVTDTGHVIINGQNLKTLNNGIVERIGSLGSMIPYNDCWVDASDMGFLVCYSDNNFPLYKKPGYNLPCNFTTVGKDEFTLEGLELNVFPNPASDNIKIEFSGENALEQFYVQVYDLLGKEVLSGTTYSGGSLNLLDVKSGLYTLNLVSDGQVLARRKLVVAQQ